MSFVVKYRTEEEIEKIKRERKYWADRVKGKPDYNVCPIEITMSDGTKVEAWDIEEEKIVSLIDHTLANMDSDQKDENRINATVKILECWTKQHKTVSANMIEGLYALEDKYPKHVDWVKDFTTSIGFDQKQNARKIADYLSGVQGDQKEITNADIVKILRTQEMIAEQRKTKEATK